MKFRHLPLTTFHLPHLSAIACSILITLSAPANAAPDAAQTERATAIVALLRDVAAANDTASCTARITAGEVKSSGASGRFLIASDPQTQTGTIEVSGLGPVNFTVGVTKTGVWVRDRNATVRDADFPGFRAGLISDIYWASGGLANACWPAAVGYVAEDNQSGEAADVLEVVPQGGKATKVWISRDSHLPLKWTRRDEPAVATTTYSAYGSGSHRALPTEQKFVDRDGTQWELHTTQVRTQVTPAEVATLSAKPQSQLHDYEIDSATSTTVPMRVVGQPFIEVSIDGRGPFNFMIDTGGTLQLSSTAIAALGLKTAGHGSDSDIDGNAHMVDFVKLPDLQIGEAHIHGLYGEEVDLNGQSSGGAKPLDGIIGNELLDRFVTTFDYSHHSLTLALGAPPALAEDTRFDIPFALDHTFPVTGGQINGVAAQFWIDTGSDPALIVNAPFAALHAAQMPSRKYGGGSISGSFGKPSPLLFGRLNSINVGQVTMSRPIALFPDISVGLSSGTETAGDMGDDVFATSALTFDYQHHRAWAVPDTGAGLQPESKYNYSGMKIKYSAPGKAIVSSVVEDSPAWNAGLRADDQVTAVDGQSISPDLVSSTNHSMSSGELKPVRLSVSRDKTRVDIVVQPQDYIQ